MRRIISSCIDIMILMLMLILVYYEPTFAASGIGPKIVIGVTGNTEQAELEKKLVGLALRNPSLLLYDVTVVEMYVDSALKSILANNGPDIVLLPVQWARMLADYDVLVDFNTIAAKDATVKSTLSRIYTGAVQSAKWRGKLMGIPHSITLTGIVYNPTHVQNAGLTISGNWTWNDFANVARKLQTNSRPIHGTRYTNTTLGITETIEVSSGFALSLGPQHWQPFLWSNGADFISESLLSTTIGSSNSRETFSWLKSLISSDAATLWINNPDSSLMKGNVSMTSALSSIYVKFPGVVASIRSNPTQTSLYPDLPETLSMAPYPISPRTGTSISTINASIYTINKSSRVIDSAIRLICALVTPNIQTSLLNVGQIPARFDVTFPKSIMLPAQEVVAKIAATARVSQPWFIGSSSLSTPVDKNLYNYYKGNLSLDSFITKTSNEVNSILRNWDGKPRSLWEGRSGVTEIDLAPVPINKKK